MDGLADEIRDEAPPDKEAAPVEFEKETPEVVEGEPTSLLFPHAPGGRGGEKLSTGEVEKLRERLKVAKAKAGQEGFPPIPPGVVQGAGGPDGKQKSSSSSSSSSSDSAADRKTGRKKTSKKAKKEKAKKVREPEKTTGGEATRGTTLTSYPGVLARTAEASGTVQPPLEVTKLKGGENAAGRLLLEQQVKQGRRKPRKGDPNPSSSSSQGKKGKKKKKKSKKSSSPGGKKKKKKAKKSAKKGKKRKRVRLQNGQIVSCSDSSSSSSRSSTESDSEESLEAPLRKKSKQHPGSVLNLLMTHIQEQLDQTAQLALPAGQRGLWTTIKVATYLSLHIRPHFQQQHREMRELHLLATALDTLRTGALAKLGDILSARFLSIHQSLLDGNWSSARFLEVEPMNEGAALSNAVLLQARRHTRMVQKTLANDGQWGPGRGRGKGGKNYNWGNWGGESEQGNRGTKGKEKSKKGGRKGKAAKGDQGGAPKSSEWKETQEKP